MAFVNSTVCQYHKFGFCRYRESCRKHHVQELCEDLQCDVNACTRRHPLSCNYFLQFQRCKFGDYCYYKHNILATSSGEFDKIMEKKIDHLESIISEINAKFSSLSDKVDDLEACKNSKEDITQYDAQVNSINGEVKGLVEVTEIYKLKLDVFNEEFFCLLKNCGWS